MREVRRKREHCLPVCTLCEVPSAISLAGVYSGLWFLWIPEGSSDPLPHQPLTISCLWLWGRVSVTLLRLDSSSFVRQLVVAPKFFCYTLPLRSFIPFFLLFTYRWWGWGGRGSFLVGAFSWSLNTSPQKGFYDLSTCRTGSTIPGSFLHLQWSSIAFWGTGLASCDEPANAKMQETWVRSLDWEDSLEEEMAIHSSILAWEIPWTEEPGRLYSMGLQELDMTEHAHTTS